MKRIFSILALCLFSLAGYAQTGDAPLPKMHGSLAGANRGEVKKEVISAQLGVLVSINDDQKILDAWKQYRYLVTNFTIEVIRNNKEIFTRNTQGAKFDTATHDFLQTLRRGDMIRIWYIYCKIWPIDKTITIDPVEVTIK